MQTTVEELLASQEVMWVGLGYTELEYALQKILKRMALGYQQIIQNQINLICSSKPKHQLHYVSHPKQIACSQQIRVIDCPDELKVLGADIFSKEVDPH